MLDISIGFARAQPGPSLICIEMLGTRGQGTKESKHMFECIRFC